VSAKGRGAKAGKSTPAKKGGKSGKETPAIKEAMEQMIPVPQKEPTQLKKRGEEDNAIQTIGEVWWCVCNGLSSVCLVSW